MKKSIVFIFGALLALGACTKTAEMPDGTSDSKALKFRLAVNTPTKGDVVAYKGIDASQLNEILVYASVRKDNGEVSQKSVFWNNSNTPIIPGTGRFEYNSSEWQLTDGSNEFKNLPKGSHMDLVTFGSYKGSFNMSNYYVSSAQKSTYEDAIDHGFNYMANDRKWTPYVFEDSKAIDEKVYFIGVDTYKDQQDVVYAVKNGIAADGSTHTVTLKHAQALININIKVKDAIPDYVKGCCIAFIGANTEFSSTTYPDYHTMKDYILGENTSHFMDGFMDAAESDNRSKFDDYLPLKTVGSFLIDNSLNNPVVGWQFPKLSEDETWTNLQDYSDDAGNYKVGGYAILSNKEKSTDFNNPFGYANPTDLIEDSMTPNEFYQAAGQLIPEQKIVNPWIWFYDNSNKCYLTEVNLPKGVWQAGHVYTYNLTLSFAAKPKFTVSVEDYVSPFEVFDATL